MFLILKLATAFSVAFNQKPWIIQIVVIIAPTYRETETREGWLTCPNFHGELGGNLGFISGSYVTEMLTRQLKSTMESIKRRMDTEEKWIIGNHKISWEVILEYEGKEQKGYDKCY